MCLCSEDLQGGREGGFNQPFHPSLPVERAREDENKTSFTDIVYVRTVVGAGALSLLKRRICGSGAKTREGGWETE